MAQKYLKLSNILRRLLFDNNMKAVDLAREVNIPAPTIHRLITGKSTRPYKSSLLPIADYFSVKIEQLIGEEPLPGILPTSESQALNTKETKLHYIPLIPWESLSNNVTIGIISYEKLPFFGKISDDGYSTIIQDSSMEPVFAKGSLLIFDEQKLPKDRSYVLAQLHDTQQVIFRQLLLDAEHNYLKPLNPDLNAFKMRLLTKQDKILATLVEARQIYSET
jgi:transcriptional regulator with XRE-family HTH domain